MSISSTGVGSSLDVQGIVSQLMQAESQPLRLLDKKEASFKSKISAFGTLNSSLSAFNTALAGLSNPAKFRAVSTTPGDKEILTATGTDKAEAGTYTINTTQLAQAHSVAALGQASTTSAIGDGAKTTITIQLGTISGGTLTNGIYTGAGFSPDADKAAKSVVIDSSNNSLQGIRDAINKADMGVVATIVSDGTDAPNRLVLTSKETGAESSMKVTVARDGAAPAYDPGVPGTTELTDLLSYDATSAAGQKLTQTSAGQDTKMTVNGIVVSSPKASVADAIQGITLNALKVGSTTLKVERDTASIEAAANSFVKAYNDLEKTTRDLSSYDANTKKAGPLLGDFSVRNLQQQLRRMVGTPTDSGGTLTLMSQVGISFQKDGTLALDSTKFKDALAKNFGDVASLFATTGVATDSLVKYNGSSTATATGLTAITVSQLATRGSVTGTAAPSSSTTITPDSNDTLSMTIDGKAATVKLSAGTYTAQELMTHVQSQVNVNAAFKDAGIKVTISAAADGTWTITSDSYGSKSNVSISGNGATNLMGQASSTGTAGIDAAGTIGGIEAKGDGQLLTGAAGSAHDGMRLTILGGAIGARGTVRLSHGAATTLKELTDKYLGSAGTITSYTQSLQNSVKSVEKARDAMNDRLAKTEARYRAQFTALDQMLGKMNTTSVFLSQQLG